MTQQLTYELIILLIVYLYGSIPFSVILGTKIKGIDVRKHGSGNPGGTNSIRWLGKPVGFTIIILDALKGGGAILLVRLGVINIEMIPVLAFGVVGALGHVYPVFMKFKGGKAVAATAGMLVGYNFIWALITVVVFFIGIKISKYVSIGSTTVPFTMVALALIYGFSGTQVFPYTEQPNFLLFELPFILIMMFVIIFRHRSNYNNIKNGVEPKVKWAMKKAE